MLIFSISEKIAIFGPSRPEACLAKPTNFFEGEQGTGVGGDGVEEKNKPRVHTSVRRAPARAYAVRLGLPSFPQNVR